MTRSAELQLCANQKHAKLELRTPIARFMAPMHDLKSWWLPPKRRSGFGVGYDGC